MQATVDFRQWESGATPQFPLRQISGSQAPILVENTESPAVSKRSKPVPLSVHNFSRAKGLPADEVLSCYSIAYFFHI